MVKVTSKTKLSVLRELVRGGRPANGRISPRLVRSIQQSLAVEGYVYSEKKVRDIGKRTPR